MITNKSRKEIYFLVEMGLRDSVRYNLVSIIRCTAPYHGYRIILHFCTILAMNLQIINDCAGTDPGLQTAGTDPG